ncbi:hypothetical protein BQ8482_110314 [Mesorhizobium delmotii]|uniref:Uncharacterized protein n=1 Tax=Mesorhizobium delmotii TaxID=1631247 RepID=A0A2P9AB75_9HYPH|nr:hypothetical protein BQ8482_110314 [Mesorhizobium delmotii]
MMTTTPQVALVTGATSGIGKATAIALAAAGFQVIGTGRNTAKLTAPAGVTYLDLDVTRDESVASAVKQVIDRFGHIDVLVNNAGVGTTGAQPRSSRLPRRRTSSTLTSTASCGRPRRSCRTCASKAADASSMSPPSAGSSPARSWPSTSRPSTRSRATPNRWTTRFAITASGSCSSSPARSTLRSQATAWRPTPPCRSTRRDGATTTSCWGRTSATATTPPSSPR